VGASAAQQLDELTKGLSRMAVGAWSRSAPLRGTPLRLLLDWSPSQLIQVFCRRRSGVTGPRDIDDDRG
jgi:hypothetical protein